MIGKTISHYKIIEKIGEGGMGVVYRAEDTKLKRTVVLMFLHPDMIRDTEAKERFIQEAHHSLFDLLEMQEELETIFGRKVDLVEKEGLRNLIRRKSILKSREVVYAA
jgi:serine/threonine protein kinase